MLHRGEILKKRVEESAVKLSKIASALKVSRQTIYRMFDDKDLSLDYIIKVGKVINFDFSKDIPEIANQDRKKEAEDNLTYKLKYFDLLEKYTLLLEDQGKYTPKKKK